MDIGNTEEPEEPEEPEEMGAFFDARATGYDDHMRGHVFDEAIFAQFYQAVSALVSAKIRGGHG